MSGVTLFAVLVLIGVCADLVHSKCEISIAKDMNTEHPPLVLSRNPLSIRYAEPDNPGNLVFKPGESIGLYCPHGTKQNSFEVKTQSRIVLNDKIKLGAFETAFCVNGDVFNVHGKQVHFHKISCEKTKQQGAIIRPTGGKCHNGDNFEIGFDLTDATSESPSFIKTIDLCFDSNQETTLWAHATIIAGNKRECRYIRKDDRVPFKTGAMFNAAVKKIYMKKYQLESFEQQIGNAAHKYIENSPSMLSRAYDEKWNYSNCYCVL